MTRPAVLITGASSGIGAATARLCAEAGWDVGIGFRSERAGAKATAEAVEKAGGRAVLLQGDVSDPAGIEAVYAGFDEAFPVMSGLVNNAGIVDVTARLDEMSPERIARMMAVNVTGTMLVAQGAVKRMSTRHGGSGGAIVNISSVAAKLGSPALFVDYATSKGAIDTFTRGLALEVAAEGIRVNGVRPGMIYTPIHEKGGYADRPKELAHIIPMQRIGEPEEIGEAVVWLLSDKASYATGTTFDVSGGR